jgi:carbamoyl-phosphate synthase large subunit
MGNIAITGLNAGDSPAPGIPVVRCLTEHPEWSGRICGMAYDVLESGGLDRRLISSVYLLPYPNAGRESLLERITYIHNLRFPDPDGIFDYNSVTAFGILMLKSRSKLVIFGQSLFAGACYAQAAATSRLS